MNFPKLTDVNVSGKKVIVRADLDFNPKDQGNLRLASLIPTLDYLTTKKAQIVLIAHRGRPQGKDPSLSLMPLQSYFKKWPITLLENLRFDPGEESNDPTFTKKLASHGDFYVNEAFGASHREHASIVGLPKLLPHAAGLRFAQEVENLSKIIENPKHPLVMLISGAKDDKLQFIESFLKFADKILIGGRLPDYIHDASPLRRNPKVSVASLIADKEDISVHSIETFENEIAKAETLVVSGPLGKFEDEGHSQGTQRVLNKVALSSAFKVAGGGDTQVAINLFHLNAKFDWISVGGGAMLEFLANGTLPGIKALLL